MLRRLGCPPPPFRAVAATDALELGVDVPPPPPFRAVAATNALELGVDVGSLDVTLHLGFPGSVASLRSGGGGAHTPWWGLAEARC